MIIANQIEALKVVTNTNSSSKHWYENATKLVKCIIYTVVNNCPWYLVWVILGQRFWWKCIVITVLKSSDLSSFSRVREPVGNRSTFQVSSRRSLFLSSKQIFAVDFYSTQNYYFTARKNHRNIFEKTSQIHDFYDVFELIKRFSNDLLR